MTLLHKLGAGLLALLALLGYVLGLKRKAAKAERERDAERILKEHAEHTAHVQTEAAEGARQGASALSAVVAAGQPKEGDPVEPVKARRVRVKRAEDEARAQLAAAKVRREVKRKAARK